MIKSFRTSIVLLVMLAATVPALAADAIFKVGETNTDSTQSHSNRNQSFGGGGGGTIHYGAYFLELAGAGYFVARDGTGDDHDKLWRTDGTPAGTTLVRVLPNRFSATSTTVSAAVKSGGILYYLAEGSLVRSDGTAAGTYRLAADAREMVDVNGTLYFAASGDKGLYKTSGTRDSTVKIKVFGGFAPAYLANVSGVLFFNGDDGVNGRELWKSDGTAPGTAMVRDIRQAAGESGDPRLVTASGGKAYFFASGLPGAQLWVSDGTEPGTLMLRNFTDSNNPQADIRHLTDLNGTLIAFVGGSAYFNLKIYKSNGTAASTQIADPGPFGLFLPTSKDMVTTVGDTMYFLGGDRAGSSASFVYKTTGGVATQVSGQYINAQVPIGTGHRASGPILAVGNTVYFCNSPDNSVSIEVAAITHNVAGSERNAADVNPASNSPIVPYDFGQLNGRLFFTQDNSVTGVSPYITDGVTTTLLKDINATTLGTYISRDLSAVGGGKFFFRTSGVPTKLFFTTGTGITLIGQTPALQVAKLVGFNGGAVFDGQSSAGFGLHVTDGSTPTLLKASAGNEFLSLHSAGGIVYFMLRVNTPTNNFDNQLWKTNGTPGGTVFVKSFTKAGSVQQIQVVNGVTFMVASDGVTGLELWRTNGTEAGTTLVKDIQPSDSIGYDQLILDGKASYLLPFSGGVYFIVRRPDNSTSFYKSDGTDIGTVEVLSKTNGLPYGGRMLGVSNDLLYYRGAYIHTFNGTSSAEILNDSPSGAFADVNGTAFFGTSTGLYKSNGTAAGTALLLPDTSSATEYTSFAGKLFFLRYTANEGKELWRSDGTVAGTFLVQDLLPGFKDGVVSILNSTNGTLFLSGRNAGDNYELFGTLATSAAITRPTVTPQTVQGMVGNPLSVQVQFTGVGATPYSNERPTNTTFGFGYLPGMIFNPGSGIINGTPSESGFSQFEIFVQNEGGTASAWIDFNISPPVGPRVLDVDANNAYEPLTDGLLVIRYFFGLIGTALTNGAIGIDPARSSPAEILQRLSAIRSQLDIDNNGQFEPQKDGIMLIRYLFGFRGSALIAGGFGEGAMRTTAAEVEAYIQSIMP